VFVDPALAKFSTKESPSVARIKVMGWIFISALSAWKLSRDDPVDAWWQARPQMAPVENFAAKDDYASFRLNADIRANRRAVRF
jgi:hypothetical protein